MISSPVGIRVVNFGLVEDQKQFRDLVKKAAVLTDDVHDEGSCKGRIDVIRQTLTIKKVGLLEQRSMRWLTIRPKTQTNPVRLIQEAQTLVGLVQIVQRS